MLSIPSPAARKPLLPFCSAYNIFAASFHSYPICFPKALAFPASEAGDITFRLLLENFFPLIRQQGSSRIGAYAAGLIHRLLTYRVLIPALAYLNVHSPRSCHQLLLLLYCTTYTIVNNLMLLFYLY